MKKAAILFREGLSERHEYFCSGLHACGYSVLSALPYADSGDVLIIWNRYGRSDIQAKQVERGGGRVIVVENGHLGKSWRGKTWFAMALGHHAGAGTWYNGGPQRWDSWGIELAPWRTNGSHELILAQRGIGEAGIASPKQWAEKVQARLPNARIRQHPEQVGLTVPVPPLDEDLAHARAVICWHSAAAAAALMRGVPVWYDCPSWIGREAGKPLAALFAGEEPLRDDAKRLNMFRNLAWAMWSVGEIKTGEALRHLLAPPVTVAHETIGHGQQ